MKLATILAGTFVLYSCLLNTIKCQRFADHPLSPYITVSHIAYRDRRNKAEPTCEELRAMWRYSKRQSRAAEITNDLPMYRDPFSYNVWESYPVRSTVSSGYRALNERSEQAHNRGGGGGGGGGGRAPVYGKMVHKAPPESRLRNGMPNRMRAFDEVARMYGTINRQPPDLRRPQNNFRVGGVSHVPQAGSFQHLKELIRTERARELQEQRMAEEMAARASTINDITEDQRGKVSESRHYLNTIQSYQEPKHINHNFGRSQYVPSLSGFGDGLLRSDEYDRNSMLH